MSYAIIGFGKIGQALAKAFARKGIEVSVATTRDPESFAADAAAIGPTIIPKTLAEAVKADIVFLAVRFESHPDVAKALPTWQGKTVIDVTNAYGVPPEELEDSLLPRSSRRPSRGRAGRASTIGSGRQRRIQAGSCGSDVVILATNWADAPEALKGIRLARPHTRRRDERPHGRETGYQRCRRSEIGCRVGGPHVERDSRRNGARGQAGKVDQ